MKSYECLKAEMETVQQLFVETKKNKRANSPKEVKRRTIPKWEAYYSSKAAASSFLDCLNKEQTHEQVQHFDSGVLDTDMQKKIRQSVIESKCENRILSKLKENGGLLKPDIATQKIINTLIEKQML